MKAMVLALGLMVIGCGAPLSEADKQAAEDEFRSFVDNLAGSGDRQAQGLVDDLWNGFKQKAENLALCQVLRPIMGDDPQVARMIYFKGHVEEITTLHQTKEFGRESMFDLANYQSVAFQYTAEGFDSGKLAALYSGVYAGVGYGDQRSALALGGKRSTQGVELGIPLLSKLPLVGGAFKSEITHHGIANGETSAHAVGGTAKVGLAFTNPIRKLLPLSFANVQVQSGHWIPFSEATSAIADRDANLGATLQTLQCNGKTYAYVQYGDDSNSHRERAEALTEAMSRSNVGIDLLAKGVGVAAGAIAIARDRGGFSALCDGGAADGPAPMPEPPTCEQILHALGEQGAGSTGGSQDLATEGQGCFQRTCAEGLTCTPVLMQWQGDDSQPNLLTGNVNDKRCLQSCITAGTRDGCQAGEICTAAADGNNYCFNDNKDQDVDGVRFADLFETPATAFEGQGCWQRSCGAGLACTGVKADPAQATYVVTDGGAEHKVCMEQCKSDLACEPGEVCTDTGNGKVCFAATNSDAGFVTL